MRWGRQPAGQSLASPGAADSPERLGRRLFSRLFHNTSIGWLVSDESAPRIRNEFAPKGSPHQAGEAGVMAAAESGQQNSVTASRLQRCLSFCRSPGIPPRTRVIGELHECVVGKLVSNSAVVPRGGIPPAQGVVLALPERTAWRRRRLACSQPII